MAVAASNFLGGVAVGASLNDPEFDSALAWAYENEMTKFDTVDGFMPYANITREQASKFVDVYAMTNLCLSPDAEMDCDFSDIPADESLDEYVMLSCQLGLFKGSNGKFMPTANLTKAQLLAVLVRAIKAAAGEEAVSEDGNPWWSNYYTEAKELGLTKETNVNALDKPVSRYEALLMMYRARIEDQCSTTSDDITDLLKDLFGDDATDSDSETGAVATSDGTLEISLSPTTPAGSKVPGLANVVVAEFEVSATTEAVMLNTIELKRFGISNDDAVSRVSLFLSDGTRLTNGKSFNSEDTALLNLSPRLEVGVGEELKIQVVAEIGDSAQASNQDFQIGINAADDVTTNGEVDGSFPIKGNSFEVGGENAPELTINPDGTLPDVELGEKGAEIAAFELDNGSSDDIELTHITFTDGEGNIDDAMMNFVLECDGEEIATTDDANDDYLSFTFDPFMVQDGETVDCNVFADVVASAGESVALYIDESLDVMGSSDFGFGIAVDVDNYQEVDAQVIDILAGELTLVEQKNDTDEVREDQDDVVLGEFKVVVNNGQALYIEDISMDLFSDANPNNVPLEDIFENFELYDVTNHTRYDLNNTNGTDINLSEENIDVYLPDAGEITLQVRADTVSTFPANVADMVSVHLELDAAPGNGDLVIKESDDDEQVMDLVPSFISFDAIDLVESAVDVTGIPLADTSVVRGATEVVALQFQVETDEVSPAFLQEISIDGTANFDTDHVSAVSLFRGTPSGTHTLVESKGGFDINSNSVTFDDFDEIEVPKNSTQPFFVTLDIVDDPNIVGDQIELAVDTNPAPDLEDDNNNDMQVNINNLANPRTITISNFGTLTCDFDVNDEETDIPSIVLGGEESDYLASFEFNAQNEDIWVRDILITAAPAPNFVDAFEEVVLADEDGNELYREIITSNAMYLNEIETASGAGDFIITEGDTNLYVKLVASLIGKNLNGMEAGAYNLTMSVQQAEGVSSDDDIATNVSPVNCGGGSEDFYSRAVAISNVDLVSSAGTTSLPSYLSNGVSNKLGIVKVVADNWDNNDPADASSINITLDTLRVEFENGTEDPVANVTVKKVGKTTTTTPQNVAAGTNIVSFDMDGDLGVDATIQKGQTVYYVIEGTPVIDDTDESIRINLSDLYGGGNASFEYYGDFGGSATTDAVYLEDSEIDGVLLVDNNS